MHHHQLFMFSAEVQTPSAEQARVQAAGREKETKKNDAKIIFENMSNLFHPWKLVIP